jgi:ubiquinone/menaquinone biosynthesis C-methylase UbiE
MNRQEFYRKKYQSIKSGWKDSQIIYRDIIDGLVEKDTKILDVGCSHGDFMGSVYQKTEFVYGLDIDEKALAKNKIIKNKIHSSIKKMPFDDSFFDLIVNAWVMEHLENPERAFKEVYRVLKPNGKVIFLTPNVWNYNIWIIRMIPRKFHDFFTRRLYDRQENDTFLKYYKINSVKKIDKILTATGLKKIKVILNDDPTYISFSKFLFAFACFLEKLLDKWFNFAKVHIIGIYEK